MSALWLPALAELAVRDVLHGRGLVTQLYPGTRGPCLFWPERHKYLNGEHFPKARFYKKRCLSWYVWEGRPFSPARGLYGEASPEGQVRDHHPLCPTGHLYFFGSAWGASIERWWRLADERKEPRSVWVGQGSTLHRVVDRLVAAMVADTERLQEEFKADEVDELLGGTRHKTVRSYLSELGINDHHRLWEPVLGDRHGEDAARQGQGLGAGGGRSVPHAFRLRRQARLAGA